MSESFNGYHVWLGIPPNEQPPNHYRLLGIAIFETDLDVIDHAADRQMAHVRTFQAGRHGGLSQQILNELAAARVCLLNSDRKQEYDSQLRAKLTAAPQVAAVPVGKAVPIAQPAIPTAIPAEPVRAVRAPAAAPARSAPAAIPIDELDGYGLDAPDGATSFDDYEQELVTAAAGSPMINPLAVRRSTKTDLAFQRAITYTLIGLAVVIVLMIGYQLFQRFVGPVGDLFKQAPVTESTTDAGLPPASAPKAPAPAPPGGPAE